MTKSREVTVVATRHPLNAILAAAAGEAGSRKAACLEFFEMGGAMAGGLSLGAAEATAPLVLLEPLGVDGVSQLRDAVAFAVLIFVLLVKPSGLFGERLSEEDRA